MPLCRLMLLAVTLLGIAATAWLVSATQNLKQLQRDQRFAEVWRKQSISEPKSAAAPIIAQWAMREDRSAEKRTLTWSVTDLAQLRSSLLALDSASVTVTTITVNKSDAALTVVAELAP